ncbi:hypothetical protein K503DRAFT_807204 [Rhizopogon vinicolor AM-OR11-026]|uniref:Uncharacterized protein n=1 Tax=Rhizopogon vinicolor AM-OR11-026 TaxID=1314800 RepID=A0A1B7MD10_9AGAM|nr:hypothetical protein K503DRAFT_807204 [Rhizopogon vinicolor AM-OR11-026]
MHIQLAFTSSASLLTSLPSFLWFYYLYHSESISKKYYCDSSSQLRAMTNLSLPDAMQDPVLASIQT